MSTLLSSVRSHHELYRDDDGTEHYEYKIELDFGGRWQEIDKGHGIGGLDAALDRIVRFLWSMNENGLGE